jgi:hypothetical protein
MKHPTYVRKLWKDPPLQGQFSEAGFLSSPSRTREGACENPVLHVQGIRDSHESHMKQPFSLCLVLFWKMEHFRKICSYVNL